MIKRLRGGWGAGLRFVEEASPPEARRNHVTSICRKAKTPPWGGVLGGLFYDGDSGIGGAGVLLDGGEEQRLIHQLIGGAAVVARCNAEPRDLIELCDGEVIRQGEYAEQQQGGGEDDADAGGAFCGKRTDDEIQAGQHHEAAERGVDAAPTAFAGEDGQGRDDDEQPEDGSRIPMTLRIPVLAVT